MMARSCSSSSGTSSPKYEFSDDSDSDHKLRGTSSRPRRLPTSNSKNAVAARMNRMKQKQYVKDLEQKMSTLKREVRDLKRELRDREKKWASSRRQVAYLRSMISNSHQIGALLRNVRWRNIIPQGSSSTVDKTLNELNSEMSVDRFPITTNCSLFDGCFNLLDERENNHQHLHPMEIPPIAPQDDDDWALNNGIDPPMTELFRETVPCKHVSLCTMLP